MGKEYFNNPGEGRTDMPPFGRLSDAQVLKFARGFFHSDIKSALVQDAEARAIVKRAYESVRSGSANEDLQRELSGKLVGRLRTLTQESDLSGPYDTRRYRP